MSRKNNNRVGISDPFNKNTQNTEWTCAEILVEWINQIISEANIPLGTARAKRKKVGFLNRTDIEIQSSPNGSEVICVIECKIPQWDVFNFELKEDARKKAAQRNAPYTRQEAIPDIGVDKENLIESALNDLSGNKIAAITKRAGIHAYFFVG
jgi:hypothetical protein